MVHVMLKVNWSCIKYAQCVRAHVPVHLCHGSSGWFSLLRALKELWSRVCVSSQCAAITHDAKGADITSAGICDLWPVTLCHLPVVEEKKKTHTHQGQSLRKVHCRQEVSSCLCLILWPLWVCFIWPSRKILQIAGTDNKISFNVRIFQLFVYKYCVLLSSGDGLV